jgi:hypothetical protein
MKRLADVLAINKDNEVVQRPPKHDEDKRFLQWSRLKLALGRSPTKREWEIFLLEIEGGNETISKK